MLSLPPPRMGRVVAAHLASFCRKLVDKTKLPERCEHCENKKRAVCRTCKAAMKPCDDCDGKGFIDCDMCADDPVEKAVATVLGLRVDAGHLLLQVNIQPDVFCLCVDDDKLWLPKWRGGKGWISPVPRFTKGRCDVMVARDTYDARQVPLFDDPRPT